MGGGANHLILKSIKIYVNVVLSITVKLVHQTLLTADRVPRRLVASCVTH